MVKYQEKYWKRLAFCWLELVAYLVLRMDWLLAFE